MLGFQSFLAPAKINLFLHITGQRADGYHLLQTVFRLLDFYDTVYLKPSNDGLIKRTNQIAGVSEADDLCIRAAKLLQQHTQCTMGVEIALEKRIPMGGGLGGGSSDAATVLLALNRLWQTGLGRTELQTLGLQLGADVPVFIFGRDAFAEGVGEALQSLALAPAWYVLVSPGVSIATAEIFGAGDLTRNTPLIRMPDFAVSTTRNDLQAVACKRYPQVQSAIDWLGQHAPARMTGSGSCVFAEVASAQDANEVTAQCPPAWTAWKVRSSSRHPLFEWLE